MRVVLDFETRGDIDLRKCGAHKYAETARILCAAYKVGDAPAKIWVSGILPAPPDLPTVSQTEFQADLYAATTVVAHNAQFERVLWQNDLVARRGFAPIPLERWRCTAAKAAVMSLPRGLEDAAKVLELPQQKDIDGRRVMLKMSKPRKPTKSNPAKWHENPADFYTLCRYCIQDVETEYALDNALPELSPEELEIWRIDQKINDRGVYVDLQAIQRLIYKVKIKERRLLDRFQALTGIGSPRQVAKFVDWLNARGVMVADLRKATVDDWLANPLSPVVREALEIRRSLSKSSVSKLDAMQRRANVDGRIRGSMLYHGADTGRWAGRGIQPQNYPRDAFDEDEIAELLKTGVDAADATHGCVIQAASRALRGMITAAPGYTLVCADYASIEARVLAWLAGEDWKLDAFRAYDAGAGPDMYIVSFAKGFGIPQEQVTKDQRQIGKVMELALGYQGWIGAWEEMSKSYGVRLDKEKAIEVIKAWRNSNPRIVAFWGLLDDMIIKVVSTGKGYALRGIKMEMDGEFLRLTLPSGRKLAYHKPRVAEIVTPYGRKRKVVQYWETDAITRKWALNGTYGGKLAENITQATSRDLLTFGLLQVEKHPAYRTVLHVHDEILAESKGDDFQTLEKLLSRLPAWASGLPMGASGWAGHRYRK